MLTPAIQLGVAVLLLSIFLRGMLSRLIAGVSTEQGTALLIILITCLAEEFIFRGYIQQRLSSWLGKSWGWLAASGLFIIWQIPRLLIVPSGTLLIQLGDPGCAKPAGWLDDAKKPPYPGSGAVPHHLIVVILSRLKKSNGGLA